MWLIEMVRKSRNLRSRETTWSLRNELETDIGKEWMSRKYKSSNKLTGWIEVAVQGPERPGYAFSLRWGMFQRWNTYQYVVSTFVIDVDGIDVQD